MSIKMNALKNGKTNVTLFEKTSAARKFSLPAALETPAELRTYVNGMDDKAASKIRISTGKQNHLGIITMQASADAERESLQELVNGACDLLERRTAELMGENGNGGQVKIPATEQKVKVKA